MDNKDVRVNSITDLEFPKNKIRDLGEGASGCVKLVRHKKLDKFFALKQVNVTRVGTDRTSPDKKLELIKREIKLHKKLVHPNIIRLYDYFKVKGCVFLLMELADKGNLFDILKSKERLAEEEAVRYFHQTCKGVEYLHSKNVIHRDLKPENLLISSENNELKICDFGWSVNQDDDMRTTFCGTYEYMAPEIVENKSYDMRVDIWSLGILLYEMLHGHSPFRSGKMMAVLDNIRRGVYKMREDISPESRHLIMSILQVDPSKRPTVDKILVHPLLIKHGLAPQVHRPPSPDHNNHSSIPLSINHHHSSNNDNIDKISYPQATMRGPRIVITSSRDASRDRPPSPLISNHTYTMKHQQSSPNLNNIRIEPVHPNSHTISSSFRNLVQPDQGSEQVKPKIFEVEGVIYHPPIVITSHRSFIEENKDAQQQHKPLQTGPLYPSPQHQHNRIRSTNLIPSTMLNNHNQISIKRVNSNSSLGGSNINIQYNILNERSSSRGALFDVHENTGNTNHNEGSAIGSTTYNNPQQNSMSHRSLTGFGNRAGYASIDKVQPEYVSKGYETPVSSLLQSFSHRTNLIERSKTPLQNKLGDLNGKDVGSGASTPLVVKLDRNVSKVDLNTSLASVSGHNRSDMRENRDNSVRRPNPLMQSFGKKSSNNTTIINNNSDTRRASEKTAVGEVLGETDNILAEITNKMILDQVTKLNQAPVTVHEYSRHESQSGQIQSHRSNILSKPFLVPSYELEAKLPDVDHNKTDSFYVKENYCHSERNPIISERSSNQVSFNRLENKGSSTQCLKSKLHSQIQAQLSSQSNYLNHTFQIKNKDELNMNHQSSFIQNQTNTYQKGPKIFDRGNYTLRTITKPSLNTSNNANTQRFF